jgi:signal transduction histidine kinase/ActR/RegA family two-component response regulator
LSVRLRLAIAICGALALGIVGFGSIARWEARAEAVSTSTVRLANVARQTASLLANSLSNQRAQALQLGRDPQVRVVAAGTGGEAGDSAVARLRRADSTSAAILGIEIWDSTAAIRHATNPALRSVPDSIRRLLLGRLSTADSVASGRLVLHGDSLVYATIARVSGPFSDRFVVTWRRLTIGEQEQQVLLQLIGAESRLLVGNARGVAWTDFRNLTVPPPADAADSAVTYTRPGGIPVLVRRAAVSGSLWDVAIEFPMSAIMAPASRITRVLAFAGLALLVVGAVIAWALGRSFGQPIADLADAAAALQAGEYGRVIPVRGHDEFSNLAASFNTMSAAVHDSRVRLQAHAEDLQRRSDALTAQSHQTEQANEQLRIAAADKERALRSLQAALDEKARTTAELDAALESAPVAFGFHDTELRFVRVNDRFASLASRPAADLVGRLPSEVVPGIGSNLEVGLARARDTGHPILDIEVAGGTGEPGTERQWLANLFPIRTDAGLVGLGSVMLDMTDYRLLEQRFLHAQRMEAVGRLASGIAHDFNNILTAIGSFNEFALKELSPGHPAAEDLGQVSMAVTRATGLIRQLLAFSRHQVMQPVVMDLSEVVRNLLPMLRRLIPENVQLRHDLHDDLDPVMADPVRIEQILVNLIVNSADAMPNGGHLVITTQAVVLDGEYARAPEGANRGRYAVLSVADSGAGMDAETRARAFEPFFTTKAMGRGTGLGLSTVYGIVRQSGGHIRLDSSPGGGTTIAIWLPHHDAPAPVHVPPPPRESRSPGKATILLVEDEILIRLAIRRILTSHGHEVIEAADGEAALAVLARRSARIDLVISDLVMPRMGGRELGENLRARGHLAPLLFMSGYTGDFATRQSLLDANAEFIEKPFSPDALMDKVDELLARRVPATRPRRSASA